MLGESLTMADIPLGAAVYRWNALMIRRPRHENLHAWYERLCQREAFHRHVMIPLS